MDSPCDVDEPWGSGRTRSSPLYARFQEEPEKQKNILDTLAAVGSVSNKQQTVEVCFLWFSCKLF